MVQFNLKRETKGRPFEVCLVSQPVPSTNYDLPKLFTFSFPLSAMLNSQADYRCTLVARLPFAVPRSPLPVLVTSMRTIEELSPEFVPQTFKRYFQIFLLKANQQFVEVLPTTYIFQSRSIYNVAGKVV